MWKAIESRKRIEAIVDGFNAFPDFKSQLGKPFSEESLFYTLMGNILQL
jgi:hypothetical protein